MNNDKLRRRVLAIDYGKKRVGIAISDPLKLFAAPYTTLVNTDDNSLINQIKNIIDKEDAESIVVGLPHHGDGKPSEMTYEVLQFIEKLKAATPLHVSTFDENYSSVDAKQIIKNNQPKSKLQNRNHKSNKGKVDSIAASIILQSYLDNS